jgi:SpoVK/Ycf46/Vps4 family AAA+-type ATPase
MSNNLPLSNGASAPQSPPSIGGWLAKLVINRRASQSTVVILVTSDIKRIHQVLYLDYGTLFGNRNLRVIQYILQTNQIIENGVPVETDVPPLQYLINALISSSAVVIIHYAYLRQHGDYLADFLMFLAQNERLYANGSTVIVIASDLSLFPEVIRKFFIVPEEDEILPTEEETEALINSLVSEFSKKIHVEFDKKVVPYFYKLPLHVTESAILKSIYETQSIDPKYAIEYKIELLKKQGLEYIQPSRGFESVGGYDYIKKYIMNRVVRIIRDQELASKYGLKIPKGILLYGPPGTGKTWIAKALAKEVGIPMVIVDSSTFLRGIVGETEKTVKGVFRVVESVSPAIVLIDEFDQLAPARTSFVSTDSNVSKRMENMLLSIFGDEKRQSFLVATTNLISDIDPAFLRPGRIDEIMPVFYPDYNARLEILRIHTSIVRKVPLHNVDLNVVAKQTYLWTGAELEKLVTEASALAMDENTEVQQKHFDEAISLFEINVQERIKTVQRMISEAKTTVNKKLLNEALKALSNETSSDERVKSLLAQLK